MSDIFAYINSLNNKNEYLIEADESGFDPFMTNRAMSLFADTILYANEANQMAHVDKKLVYDFYYYGVRKKSRFTKWPKKLKDDDVELIMHNYCYSESKAIAVKKILSAQQLEEIRLRLQNTGGVQ